MELFNYTLVPYAKIILNFPGAFCAISNLGSDPNPVVFLVNSVADW
jgi:hypothetical protein